MMATHRNEARLSDVLVVSIKKSFWASRECEIFPNRIYTKTFYGNSMNRVNTYFVTFRAFAYCLARRPRLILFGSTHTSVPWFIRFRKAGLLPKMKLIATNQICFSDVDAQWLDKIIVYTRDEISHHSAGETGRYVFLPLPADGNFEACRPYQDGVYIFSGGGNGRDFRSVIEAIRDLDLKLKIVTFTPKHLKYDGQMPGNCEVAWRMPLQNYLDLMAGSLFVVVPLVDFWWPHGQTTVVQAQRLGKAVISTANNTVDDYIQDGQEGLLVSPYDIAGYREAILKLLTNVEMRRSCEQYARLKAVDLTYQAFAERLVDLCSETMR